MIIQVMPKWFAVVCNALISSDCKSATKYLGSQFVVRATWRTRPHKKNTREEMVVTYGAPNYLESAAIKRMLKEGVTLPLKMVVLKPWPKKRT